MTPDPTFVAALCIALVSAAIAWSWYAKRRQE
jgi:hypothetical protein